MWEYPVNPYNKESQPLSHYLQEQKNWKRFFDHAFAPIHEAYGPKPLPPIPPMPFPASSAPASRATGPQMTRAEVAALMAAPLTPAQRAHIAEADARIARMERARDRNAVIGLAVFVLVVLLVIARWH